MLTPDFMLKPLAWLVLFILYVAAANLFSPYPRGSDQYWNVGNADRVVNIDGKYKTNNIYPASFPENLSQLPRPWLQNRPVVYVATILTYPVRNAQRAWIILNCLLVFLSGLVLQKIIARDASAQPGLDLLTVLLFLVFPMNFYLSLQALPELCNQLLVLLVVSLLMDRPGDYLRLSIAALVCGLLIYQRDNYVLLVPLIPLYLGVFAEKGRKVRSVGLFIIITLIMFIVKSSILLSHNVKAIEFLSVVTKERYNQSTMSPYLYANMPEQPLSRSMEVVLGRVKYAFTAQFGINKSIAIFFWMVNLLMLPYLFLLAKYRRLSPIQKRGVFLTSIFVVTHFVTVALFQNQYRFSAVLVPLLFLCLYWSLPFLNKPKLVRLAFIALIPIFILVDVFLGRQNLRDSKNEHQLVLAVQKEKKENIHGRPVFIDFTADNPWLIGFALSPNLCYYFPGDTDMADLQNASTKLQTSMFFIQKNTYFYQRISPIIESEKLIDEKNRLVLVKLDLKKPLP